MHDCIDFLHRVQRFPGTATIVKCAECGREYDIILRDDAPSNASPRQNPSREVLRNRFAHVLTGSPLANDRGLIALLVDAATRVEGKGYLGDDDE